MKIHASVVFPVLTLITFATVAHADRAKAKTEYEEAVRRYDLNEFPAALEHFKQAYLEYEEPTFLYNIAQCHRQLGDKQQAVLFYRSYLRKVPDATNADEVRQLIANLEASIARDKASAAATPTVAPSPTPATTNVQLTQPPPPKSPVYKKWWLWTAVGVVVAGGAVGLGLGLSGHGEPTLSTVRAMP